MAPLTFGGESSADGAQFQPTALPSARYSDAANSLMIQEGLAAPTADAQGQSGQGSAAAADGAAGAGHQSLSPRHREAVRSFFAPSR